MEIVNRFCFCDEEEPTLLRYFQENNIVYDKGELVSVLEISETNPHWNYIKEYFQKAGNSYISETLFSKEELQDAEWLTVRSVWHFEYPQPIEERRYESVTYTQIDHCAECGIGLRQKDSFRIKKAPKWGKRHFLMLNWIEDELFVDGVCKPLLEKEFSFLSFLVVKNKNEATLSDVFQLRIPTLECEGIIEEQESLRGVLKCPVCGRKKYHPNGRGRLCFKRDAFESAPDIVKTRDWFGWGCGASHNIIISQKIYQFLQRNRLERGLVFSPIELVD